MMTTLDCSPYCESFLDHSDSNGNVPMHLIRQIFRDHHFTPDRVIPVFQSETDQSLWSNGVTILHWLGY